MATRFPPWDAEIVQQVADVLGETATGLTGTEIGQLLAIVGVPDPGSGVTKRHRLGFALNEQQRRDMASNCVIRFITEAMKPVRYIREPGMRTLRQDALNEVLVFVGLYIREDGKIARGAKATTLSEAARHANTLRAELRRRGTHPDVTRYCTEELLARNAFHAQLEATKSIFDKLRARTGASGDGSTLVDATLGLGQSGRPMLAINSLSTVTERDEQKGFVNLLKGLSSMFRNPVAHDPRLNRTVADDELLELLTTLSMIHRRIDSAANVK